MFRILLKFTSYFALIGGAGLGYGFAVEPAMLKTRHVSIASPDYAGAPLKIALLSDIHIGGRHVPAERVKTIVKRVNAQSPDLILIAGDYISGHLSRRENSAAFNAEIDEGLNALSSLAAPQGVYSAIGNHDVWYAPDYVARALNRAGITSLQNDVALTESGHCIGGLADAQTQEEDPSIFELCPDDSEIIAVMHSPDSFFLVPTETALALAGHTHGGQINLPFLGRRVTATDLGPAYAYGQVDIRGVLGFVTAGIGTSILPVRFRAPPEIVVIDLVPVGQGN